GGFDLSLLLQLVRLRVILLDGVFLRRVRLEAVVDLRLVALLVLAGAAAEEDAAVEAVAVGAALQLPHEVGPPAPLLQLARCGLPAATRSRPTGPGSAGRRGRS